MPQSSIILWSKSILSHIDTHFKFGPLQEIIEITSSQALNLCKHNRAAENNSQAITASSLSIVIQTSDVVLGGTSVRRKSVNTVFPLNMSLGHQGWLADKENIFSDTFYVSPPVRITQTV